jgi:hypothetical protein
VGYIPKQRTTPKSIGMVLIIFLMVLFLNSVLYYE